LLVTCVLSQGLLGCGELARVNPYDPGASVQVTISGPSTIKALNDTVSYSVDVAPSAQGAQISLASSDSTVLYPVPHTINTYVALKYGRATLMAKFGAHAATLDVSVQPVVGTHHLSFCDGSSTNFSSIGEQRALCAYATDTLGVPIAGLPLFSTSDSTVIQFPYYNVATSFREGSAILYADWWGAAKDSVAVTVKQRVASVVVSGDNGSTAIPGLGGTLQLTAQPLDSNRHVIDGRLATWTSDRPGAVDVSASGLVTSRALGVAVITATAEGVSGSLLVHVVGGTAPTFASTKAGLTTLYDPSGDIVGSIVLGTLTVVDGDGDADSLAVHVRYAPVHDSSTLALPLAVETSTQAATWLTSTQFQPVAQVTGTVQAFDLSGHQAAPYIFTATVGQNTGGPTLDSATAAGIGPNTLSVQVFGSDSALDVQEVFVTPSGCTPIRRAVVQSSATFNLTAVVTLTCNYGGGLIVVLRDSSGRLSAARLIF